MDILSLRYFIAAAEYNSFSKAAEYSYTTQPNISKHIQRLEEELNVQLFNRTGKNVELTDAGLKCLVEIRHIVEEMDSLKVNANKYKLGEYGDLKVGYTGEFEYRKFSKIINSFSSKHPNINISFARGSQSEVLNALLEEQLDVILTLATGLKEIENICYREIAKNKLILIVPEGHRFANYTLVKKEDFLDEPIIMFTRDASPFVYDELIKYLQVNHLYQNVVSYENDLQSMLLKVESGKGITILTALSLRSSANKIHIVNFEYDKIKTNVNLALVWKANNSNPSLQLFLEDCFK